MLICINSKTNSRSSSILLPKKNRDAMHCVSTVLADRTRLELATPCVTGMYSNQTELPIRVS